MQFWEALLLCNPEFPLHSAPVRDNLVNFRSGHVSIGRMPINSGMHNKSASQNCIVRRRIYTRALNDVRSNRCEVKSRNCKLSNFWEPPLRSHKEVAAFFVFTELLPTSRHLRAFYRSGQFKYNDASRALGAARLVVLLSYRHRGGRVRPFQRAHAAPLQRTRLAKGLVRGSRGSRGTSRGPPRCRP